MGPSFHPSIPFPSEQWEQDKPTPRSKGMPRTGSLDQVVVWGLVFLTCMAILFVGLGSYPLYDPDEGRNAEVAREIVTESHWLPPTLSGEVRYQKPPLYYWLVAGFFEVLGITETAARLPSALAALACLLVTLLLGREIWGTTASGAWAATILATSLLFAAYARIVIFDMVLTLFITSSIAFFWIGMEKKRGWCLHLSALFTALAFLTKGPIGVLIPTMALVPVLVVKQKRETRPQIPWPTIGLIFVLVSLPVYAAAEIKAPGYCYRFFWEENVLRYLTPRYHRQGPVFYYLVVILVGLFPWTWLLKELPKTLEGLKDDNWDELVLLGSWIVLPTIFFTLSKSKLPHYILPTFPAWALLLSRSFQEKTLHRWRSNLSLLVCATGTLYLTGLYLVVGPLAKNHSAAPLVQRSEMGLISPVVAFRTKPYSLAFYAGREIEELHTEKALQIRVERSQNLYLFTEKKIKYLNLIASVAREQEKKWKVVGSSGRYLLVKVYTTHQQEERRVRRSFPSWIIKYQTES